MKKNGMGLGLTVAYSILQSHNAKIRAQSKENEGTEFQVSFKKNYTFNAFKALSIELDSFKTGRKRSPFFLIAERYFAIVNCLGLNW
jgi:hypothetical protein